MYSKHTDTHPSSPSNPFNFKLNSPRTVKCTEVMVLYCSSWYVLYCPVNTGSYVTKRKNWYKDHAVRSILYVQPCAAHGCIQYVHKSHSLLRTVLYSVHCTVLCTGYTTVCQGLLKRFSSPWLHGTVLYNIQCTVYPVVLVVHDCDCALFGQTYLAVCVSFFLHS